MDSDKLKSTLFTKISSLEPENATKICGYLLSLNIDIKVLIRLALGPDILLQSFCQKAKSYLGLSPSINPNSRPINIHQQPLPQSSSSRNPNSLNPCLTSEIPSSSSNFSFSSINPNSRPININHQPLPQSSSSRNPNSSNPYLTPEIPSSSSNINLSSINPNSRPIHHQPLPQSFSSSSSNYGFLENSRNPNINFPPISSISRPIHHHPLSQSSSSRNPNINFPPISSISRPIHHQPLPQSSSSRNPNINFPPISSISRPIHHHQPLSRFASSRNPNISIREQSSNLASSSRSFVSEQQEQQVNRFVGTSVSFSQTGLDPGSQTQNENR